MIFPFVSSRVSRVRDVRDVRDDSAIFSDLGRSSCHGFYALLRNGLWDDPAEAVTGAVYDDFVKAVGSHDLPPATAIYLTWRYCYLKCFVLIGIVWAAASFDSWVPDRAALDSFAGSLPQEIQPNRYETFVVIMSWWNPCLMYIWSSSFLIVLAAIFFAAPSRVCKHSNRHVSRYLVWVAWLWNFFLPFAVLLVITFRHTIDHRGLKEAGADHPHRPHANHHEF